MKIRIMSDQYGIDNKCEIILQDGFITVDLSEVSSSCLNVHIRSEDELREIISNGPKEDPILVFWVDEKDSNGQRKGLFAIHLTPGQLAELFPQLVVQ
jgi:hypothetical protein